MKHILNQLFEYKKLTQAQAREVLINIANNVYNEAEISAFLAVYLMRSVSVEELTGFRDALLELCLRMDFSDFNPIDLCGTGGDGKETINISTLSSFVVAGAGGRVAKHGNYGVSSACGSSNIMEYLGYKFTNDYDTLRWQLDRAGICFLHAPFFHPAMKNVAPVRKKLGVKTFFNMLGPMVNPAFPKLQTVGVFSLELARLYHYLYQQTDKQYYILYSLDGYDEISLTGDFKLISNAGEKLYAPSFFGKQALAPAQIAGGKNVADSAALFLQILDGKGTAAQNDVVISNSAVSLKCVFPEKSWEQCIEAAQDSLLGGKAKAQLQTLLATQ